MNKESGLILHRLAIVRMDDYLLILSCERLRIDSLLLITDRLPLFAHKLPTFSAMVTENQNCNPEMSIAKHPEKSLARFSPLYSPGNIWLLICQFLGHIFHSTAYEWRSVRTSSI